MVAIADTTVLYNAKRAELRKTKTKRGDGCDNLIVGILSQCIHVSNHHLYILNILEFLSITFH